jgi:hypothetical protein
MRITTEKAEIYVKETGTINGEPLPEIPLTAAEQIAANAAKALLVAESIRKDADDGKFDGESGITPHIGENGNWWIGEEDTGVRAEGANYVFTQQDKEDITRSVLASLPTWSGGEY